MNIIKQINGTELDIKLEGRLDTTTAPELEAEFKAELGKTELLKLDFSNLEYLSSAGLRVLLFAQKTMNAKQGKMEILNVNETIMEVFNVTGFSNILTIK